MMLIDVILRAVHTIGVYSVRWFSVPDDLKYYYNLDYEICHYIIILKHRCSLFIKSQTTQSQGVSNIIFL